MGAWGHTAFENDQALDWFSNELEHSASASSLAAALAPAASAAEDDYIDSDEACCALAAAEIIAALLGRPMQDLHPMIAEWVAAHPREIDAQLIATAARAVTRVNTDSELRDLWDEAGPEEPWSASNADLLRRLTRQGH